MAIYSMKGARVSLGATAAIKSAPWVVGDFTTLLSAKTLIGELETMGMSAEEFNALEFESVTDGAVRTLKGAIKSAPVEFTFGHDYADAGQTALKAAFASEADFALEIEWGDKPATGAAPKNSRRLCIGKVMKLGDGGEGGGIAKLSFTFQPNGNWVRVNASAT